jgi:hypothetical protein
MWIDVHAIDWLKFAWREKIETAHTEIKKFDSPKMNEKIAFGPFCNIHFHHIHCQQTKKVPREFIQPENFIITTTTICFIIHALTCTSKMEFEVLQLVRYSLTLLGVCMCWILNENWRDIFDWIIKHEIAPNVSLKSRAPMRARCRLNQSPTKIFHASIARDEIMHAYGSKRKTINHFYNWFC